MRWMCSKTAPDSSVVVYRGQFTTKAYEEREIEYSADGRCQLYLDGVRVSEGPERGAPQRWYFQRVSLKLSPGSHSLCARVMQFDKKFAPRAQLSVRQGFFVRNLDAAWSCKTETMSYDMPYPCWGGVPMVRIGADYPIGILAGADDGWEEVGWFEDDRKLVAPELPMMRYDPVTPIQLKPGLWQFENYVLAYAIYHFRGHGTAKVRWSETPYDNDDYDEVNLKGNKGCRDGNWFYGKWDEFMVDGALDWPALYWRSGRYVEIETSDGVTVEVEYYRTGYPLPEYISDDPLNVIAYETLRNCCFETFMDCPYYEQLQYIGDSRLQALCIYAIGDDHRLPTKALRLFSYGAEEDGSLRSQYPSHAPQKISSFMMIWMLMLEDYYRLHGRDSLVEELRATADNLLAYWRRNTVDDFFISPPDCWNFVDWHQDWKNGVPVGSGPCSMLNLFYVLALRAYAQIYSAPAEAQYADVLLQAINQKFLDPETGLFRSFTDSEGFCEHAQILALMCGIGDAEKIVRGLRQKSLTPCSIYFSYYYFQVCQQFHWADLIEKRLDKYRALLKQNLKTLPEEFDNPRSDCHAWSSHVMLLDPITR